MIKVLIVDDSNTIREQLTQLIQSDNNLQVIGEAKNGREALRKFRSLHPDIIILDIEMPNMNGLETLKIIREENSKIPVIMFSSLTHRAANATLDALSLGANDYVAKPSQVENYKISAEEVRTQLITKIKSLCKRWQLSEESITLPMQTEKRLSSTKTTAIISDPEIIVIAASTGGPNALVEIFKNIPSDFSIPLAIVQHMPALFTQLLAERLSSISKIPVREAQHKDILRPPGAWLAPGGLHFAITRNTGYLEADIYSGPLENSCRPAADVLFRSAAQTCQSKVLAVVLTGMGRDGTDGACAIHKSGGSVIVQDEQSSVVWSMPGNVFRADIGAKIVDLEKISSELMAAARRQ